MAKKVDLEFRGHDQISPVISNVEGSTKRLDSSFGSLRMSATTLTNGLSALGSALAQTLYKVAQTANEWRKLATVQAEAELGLKTVLTSMGRYSDEYYQKLLNLASGYQQVTNFSDEVTLQGIKMLSTFGKISNDMMPDVIKTMLDLAALMGGDVRQAAQTLGLASEGITTNLRRMGISISEATRQSGDFVSIFREIRQQVDGQAEAMRQADGGFAALGNTLGDTKEKFGYFVRDALKPTVSALDQIFQAINDHLDDLKDTGELAQWAQRAADIILSVFGALAIDTAKMVDTIISIRDSITGSQELVDAQAADWEVKGINAAQEQVDMLIEKTGAAREELLQIMSMGLGQGLNADEWRKFFEALDGRSVAKLTADEIIALATKIGILGRDLSQAEKDAKKFKSAEDKVREIIENTRKSLTELIGGLDGLDKANNKAAASTKTLGQAFDLIDESKVQKLVDIFQGKTSGTLGFGQLAEPFSQAIVPAQKFSFELGELDGDLTSFTTHLSIDAKKWEEFWALDEKIDADNFARKMDLITQIAENIVKEIRSTGVDLSDIWEDVANDMANNFITAFAQIGAGAKDLGEILRSVGQSTSITLGAGAGKAAGKWAGEAAGDWLGDTLGTTIGGAIGTYVFPVIGTAIGTAIGAWVGSLFDEDAEEFRLRSKISVPGSFQEFLSAKPEDLFSLVEAGVSPGDYDSSGTQRLYSEVVTRWQDFWKTWYDAMPQAIQDSWDSVDIRQGMEAELSVFGPNMDKYMGYHIKEWLSRMDTMITNSMISAATETMGGILGVSDAKALADLWVGKQDAFFAALLQQYAEASPEELEEMLNQYGEYLDAFFKGIAGITTYAQADPLADLETLSDPTLAFQESVGIVDKQITFLSESLNDLAGMDFANALGDISDLLQDRYEMELEYLALLKSTLADLTDSLDDMTEGFKWDIMTPEEQYQYATEQAKTAWDEIFSAATPFEAATAVQDWMSWTQKLWGMGDEEWKAANLPIIELQKSDIEKWIKDVFGLEIDVVLSGHDATTGTITTGISPETETTREGGGRSDRVDRYAIEEEPELYGVEAADRAFGAAGESATALRDGLDLASGSLKQFSSALDYAVGALLAAGRDVNDYEVGI